MIIFIYFNFFFILEVMGYVYGWKYWNFHTMIFNIFEFDKKQKQKIILKKKSDDEPLLKVSSAVLLLYNRYDSPYNSICDILQTSKL